MLADSKKGSTFASVFHGIRFKVNKGWVKALTLFLCPYVSCSSQAFFFIQTKNVETKKKNSVSTRVLKTKFNPPNSNQ